jgi:hypothetical protein
MTDLNAIFIGTIVPRTLYYTSIDKEYDGTDTAYIIFTDLVITNVVNYIATYTGINVGNYLINVSLSGYSATYYTLFSDTISGNILPKTVYCYGSKIYDNNINILITISGLLNQIAYYQAKFIDSNVGLNKLIYVGSDISNIIAGNYTLPNNIYGDIYQKEIIANFTIYDKIYDKTNIAYFTYTLSGSYDVITLSSSIYTIYNDYNVGNNIINISNIYLYGTNSQSYIINNSITTTGNINQRTIYPIFNINKTYDNTTNLNIFYTLSNIIVSDIVSINYKYNLTNQNAGTQLVIIYDVSNNNNNYSIGNIYNEFINILPATLIPLFNISKIYDKNQYIYNINYTLSGLYYDNITLSSSIYGLYRDYNIGNNILVDLSNIYLYGTNSQSYIINNSITTTGYINQRIIYPIFNINKTYNGTSNLNIFYTLSNIIISDIISINYKYNLTNQNAGTQLVIIYDVSSNNNNYSIENIYNQFINILPAILIPIFNISKIYDKTQYIENIYYTLSGLYYDNITLSSSIYGLYHDYNVGTNIVDLSNIYLYGTNSQSYTINNSITTTGNINQRTIYPIFNINKTYNNTTNLNIFYTLSNVIVSDILSINYKYNLTNQNAGTQLVIIYDISNYNNNYSIANIYNQFINILPASLIPIFNISKIYDKTQYILNIYYSLSGLYDDNISISSSIYGLYRDYNVSNNILVDLSNIYLYGTNSQSYTINNSIIATGNINQRTIYPIFNINKTYDNTTNLNIFYTISNIILTDTVILNYEYFLNSPNAGSQLVVFYNIYNNNTNYIISNLYYQYINILPALLTPSFNISKIYDKTQTVKNIYYTLSGLYDNNISISSSIYGLYRNYNVGNNILVDLSNIYLYGTNSQSYTINNNIITNGNINQKELINISTNISKIYDSTTTVYNPSVLFIGIINNDTVNILNYNSRYLYSDVVSNNKVIFENIIIDNYNYTINNFSVSGTISPLFLNIEFYSLNKINDGNNIANVKYKSINIYMVDICNNYLALYTDINPGINIPINITNINLTGLLSSNYYTFSEHTISGIIYEIINIVNNNNELELEEYVIENTILYNNTNNDNDTVSNYYYYAYDNNMY